VMSKPYGPFLGAGANPLVTTLPGVRTKRPVVLTRLADASERLTADQPRLSPQSGVPPGRNGSSGPQSPHPSFRTLPAPWRSSPDLGSLPEVSPTPFRRGMIGPNVPATQDFLTTADTAGWSENALRQAEPAVRMATYIMSNTSQRAG
jgi:hypothetical protein